MANFTSFTYRQRKSNCSYLSSWGRPKISGILRLAFAGLLFTLHMDKKVSVLIIKYLRNLHPQKNGYFIFLKNIFDLTIHLYIFMSKRMTHCVLDNVQWCSQLYITIHNGRDKSVFCILKIKKHFVFTCSIWEKLFVFPRKTFCFLLKNKLFFTEIHYADCR